MREELVLGIYDVEYYWQDGLGDWHLESVRVVAEDEEHAVELVTQSRVDMPYGVCGVEYRGDA